MSIARLTFSFSEQTTETPVTGATIIQNRYNIGENFVELAFNPEDRTVASTNKVHDYFQRQLVYLGAELKTLRLSRNAPEVRSRRITQGTEAPSHIQVGADTARAVFDALFQNGEMSAENRADIEPALRELENSLQTAMKVSDDISIAQRELIQSFVQPFVDAIKEHDPDCTIAKQCLRHAAETMRLRNPRKWRLFIRQFVLRQFGTGHDKSAEFYEALCATARVYTGLGNLEGALEQMGTGMPTLQRIQGLIEEALDSADPLQ